MLLHKEMTIGQRFKHFRLQAGMSQADLAEGICSVPLISHIETDRNVPSAHTMGRLVERLRVPLREIMGEDEKMMNVSYQIEVVRVYTSKGDFSHALELINDLNQRVDILEHQHVELLTYHVECLVKSKLYREAIALCLPFVEDQQRQQTVTDETLCEMYNKLGNAYYRENEFEKAYSAFEQGHRISLKKSELGLVEARVTKNLGLTCHQLGLREDATRYLTKAYTYFDQTSNINELANTLFYMALSTENADHLKKARLLYESMNQVREAVTARQHYAFYVEAKVDYRSALENIETCTNEFDQIEDFAMCMYTLSRAALICIENICLDEAETYLTRANGYRERLDEEDQFLCSDYYKAMAKYQLQRKNYEQSVVNANIAVEMCAKMGLHVESTDSLQIIAEVYNQQGNHEDAYKLLVGIIDLLRKPLRGE